ncbi:YybH family protein [Spirosoma pomorum]
MKHIVLALISAWLLVGCKSGETANVQALNQEFIGAWNNKNADKVIGMLAEDVQFLQGNVRFNGKSEVSQKWVRETITSLNDLKTNVVSSGTDATMAYEAGTFSVDVLPEQPQQPHGFGEGNFILLWKKGTDDTWKLSYAQLEDLPVQVKQ